ncbi:TAP42-like protein [Macrophomina phaseolina MS6]|uniref:TAP42-like protein n=1 Tax=Macrophomina phaseolina (strain MS6) TaxID=1126212 RepID=K2SIS1_MACPH|nr:TAP42-like protein [Macrophomina phaseolina MS6]
MSNETEQQPQSLRALFASAEAKRKELESSYDSNSDAYQQKLQSAIATYEECLTVADRVSLFSSNEALEDVSSGDIQYMLIDYHLAELVQRITGSDRKATLLRARQSYERFFKLLDSYDVLSKSDAKLYEKYQEAPNSFSTASTTDPAARRETKIARFRTEKDLKAKLEHLNQNPSAFQNDEDALRQLHLTNIALCVHQAFASLESMAQELQILAMAPPAPPPSAGSATGDARQRDRRGDGYSERLDAPLAGLANRVGPILSADGKPLRPFTLLDNRQRVQQGVFRPDHTLPTMTIDEYLEEERKRGGIIEGGGEQSGIRPEPDEDNMEKADEETLKARAWDDFKDENPKGAGNTMNRG